MEQPQPPPIPGWDDVTNEPMTWSWFDGDKWASLSKANPTGHHYSVDPAGRANRPLGLVTWNIDAHGYEHIPRFNRLIDAICQQCTSAEPTETAPRDGSDGPDVIFFQEVSMTSKGTMLENPWIRKNYYVSGVDWFMPDTEQSFYTITLVSRWRFAAADLGALWRLHFPSHHGRYAVVCDVRLAVPVGPAGVAGVGVAAAGVGATSAAAAPPKRFFRLANVHLDSQAQQGQQGNASESQSENLRPRQVEVVAEALRGIGVAAGIVAGDFNPVVPEDDNDSVEVNGLRDCWKVLQPDQNGYTWNPKARETYPPCRMDKVAVTTTVTTPGATPGATTASDHAPVSAIPAPVTGTLLVPRSIEVLRPRAVFMPVGSVHEDAQPVEIPLSDHCGLYTTFRISKDPVPAAAGPWPARPSRA